MAFGFFKKALRCAGRAFHSATHAVSSATGAIGNAIGHVPVIGGPIHTAFNATIASPFRVADNIASGQRIDHVALGELKTQVKSAKELAPYAQMVVSVVPGVGQGVSGAIGAGLALANGQRIDKALISGVKDSLPGGPAARAAFNVGNAIMQGKPVDKVALEALPIPDVQKQALASGIHAARDIAHGKRVDASILENAKANLPPEAQKALAVGMAIGHGANLQKLAVKTISSPEVLNNLATIGAGIKHPAIEGARRVIDHTDQRHGFNVGLGLMSHDINHHSLIATRRALHPEEKRGFDLALATHMGLVTHKIPTHVHANEQFGYYARMGMRGAGKRRKNGMLKVVGKDPNAKYGSQKAYANIVKHLTLWGKIKNFLGVNV